MDRYQNGIERREQVRLPVRGRATVKTRKGDFSAETVDISAAGVCLTLPQALEVGSLYSLELEVPGNAGPGRSVVARVCFCLKQSHGFRVGLNCVTGGSP